MNAPVVCSCHAARVLTPPTDLDRVRLDFELAGRMAHLSGRALRPIP